MQRGTSAMTRILTLLTVLWALSAAPLGFAGGNDQAEAETVVARYFDALFSGDTLTVQRLLGDPLLQTRAALLNNPDYAGHLARRYQGARYAITATRALDNEQLSVEAQILLPEQPPMPTQFLLQRQTHPGDVVPQLYIIAESSPDAAR